MNTEKRSRYFKELTLNLQREGFTAGPEADEVLPVEQDGRHLCLALDAGGIRYWKEDVAGDIRSAALNKVTDIARTTAEYMSHLEAAPHLTASGLDGDYRLLADFNGVVLAGHPTQYGTQFITWERSPDQTSLEHGHYYGPNAGVDSYTAAKRDFAVRSGLIPRSALFTPEQLMEIYFCCTDVLAGLYTITDEQQECLKSVLDQIEHGVPNFDERLQKALEPDPSEVFGPDGIQSW